MRPEPSVPPPGLPLPCICIGEGAYRGPGDGALAREGDGDRGDGSAGEGTVAAATGASAPSSGAAISNAGLFLDVTAPLRALGVTVDLAAVFVAVDARTLLLGAAALPADSGAAAGICGGVALLARLPGRTAGTGLTAVAGGTRVNADGPPAEMRGGTAGGATDAAVAVPAPPLRLLVAGLLPVAGVRGGAFGITSFLGSFGLGGGRAAAAAAVAAAVAAARALALLLRRLPDGSGPGRTSGKSGPAGTSAAVEASDSLRMRDLPGVAVAAALLAIEMSAAADPVPAPPLALLSRAAGKGCTGPTSAAVSVVNPYTSSNFLSFGIGSRIGAGRLSGWYLLPVA